MSDAELNGYDEVSRTPYEKEARPSPLTGKPRLVNPYGRSE